MRHVLVVTIGDSLTDLLEEEASYFFAEALSALDVAEDVAATTQLHHEAHVFGCVKVVVDLHHVSVATGLDQLHLLEGALLEIGTCIGLF